MINLVPDREIQHHTTSTTLIPQLPQLRHLLLCIYLCIYIFSHVKAQLKKSRQNKRTFTGPK